MVETVTNYPSRSLLGHCQCIASGTGTAVAADSTGILGHGPSMGLTAAELLVTTQLGDTNCKPVNGAGTSTSRRTKAHMDWMVLWSLYWRCNKSFNQRQTLIWSTSENSGVCSSPDEVKWLILQPGINSIEPTAHLQKFQNVLEPLPQHHWKRITNASVTVTTEKNEEAKRIYYLNLTNFICRPQNLRVCWQLGSWLNVLECEHGFDRVYHSKMNTWFLYLQEVQWADKRKKIRE